MFCQENKGADIIALSRYTIESDCTLLFIHDTAFRLTIYTNEIQRCLFGYLPF